MKFKLKNKNDKQGFWVLAIILALICLVVGFMIYGMTDREKTYEYAVNGQIERSNDCYLVDGVGYCEKDNNAIRVDNYYEV